MQNFRGIAINKLPFIQGRNGSDQLRMSLDDSTAALAFGKIQQGINYSSFMNGLKKAGIELNRKMLSEMAIHDPKSFSELVEVAKKA